MPVGLGPVNEERSWEVSERKQGAFVKTVAKALRELPG